MSNKNEAEHAANGAAKAADALKTVVEDAVAATAPPDPNPEPVITDELVEAAAEFEAAVDASPASGPGGSKRPDKIHIIARIYGVLLFVSGIFDLLLYGLFGGCVAIAYNVAPEDLTIGVGEMTTLSMALLAISVVLSIVGGVLSVMLGRSLYKSRRRRVAERARVLLVVVICQIIVQIMLSGISANLVQWFIQLGILIALSVRIDPTLAQERKVERAIDKLANAEDAAEGLEGRDRTGKGYLDLNFFTLFWEFVACSVLGLILEVIWHAVVVDPGVYQDRAGLLFGPFSPIYGFGAVLVTLALNRLYNKNPVVIFLVSAVVGGGFEAFVSLFMQFGFGATAWDYSSYTILGQPDPIAVLCAGRTSTMFCVIWGILGLIWVKAFLPLLLKVVNLIPWKFRYWTTALCFLLMLANGVMTMAALDCWFERVSGAVPETAAGEFFAQNFDNDYMANRFQSMTIEPENSTRLAGQPATEA